MRGRQVPPCPGLLAYLRPECRDRTGTDARASTAALIRGPLAAVNPVTAGKRPFRSDPSQNTGAPMDVQPPRVAHPVMYHEWNRITFLHWRYPPAVAQSLLPPGLTADTYGGTAWIGLTPFLMEGVRPPALPGLPWLSRFGEINVRTYVRDTRERRGIWFLSLDAARLPAVLAARAGYRLPYFWSDVSVNVAGNRISYHCRRHHPAGARCDAEVELGAPLADTERDGLAEFLTARYRLFTVIAGRLAAAEAEHPRWPLHHARVLTLDQNLLAGAGLPAPSGDPLAHASPGVPVRIGMWHLL